MLGDGSGTGFNMRHDYMYGNESEISSFYRIPKILLENRIYSDMSADAKLLYAIFLDRASLSAANEWKDEEGRIYIIFQVEDIMRILGCGNQKASKLLAELENSYDLIERKKQGFCKPNLIYVKAVSTLMLESHVQKCENHISGSVKTTRTEVLKSHTNNTNYNNTYKNIYYKGGLTDGDEATLIYLNEGSVTYEDTVIKNDYDKKYSPAYTVSAL